MRQRRCRRSMRVQQISKPRFNWELRREVITQRRLGLPLRSRWRDDPERPIELLDSEKPAAIRDNFPSEVRYWETVLFMGKS
jgi:hypothetical protein